MLGALNVLSTRDYSIYHGLEAQIERRFSNGFLYQLSFTWSKSEDTRSFDPTFTTVAQGSSQSAAATPFDNRHPHLNWAPSDFDHTRVWQSNWVYQLPFGHGKAWGSNWSRPLDEVLGGTLLHQLGEIVGAIDVGGDQSRHTGDAFAELLQKRHTRRRE